MCGIAGIFGRKGGDEDLLRQMSDALHHRGPDAGGVWSDGEAGIGLSHRRLAIVDLTPGGAQPMTSDSGRFVLCFNGEIYNHRQLRAELEGVGAAPAGGWRGHSDTETLLEGIAQWGLEAMLARAVGMFAFALWDRQQRRLFLVRDRFGEKPLYYGWIGRDLVFASELKALRRMPGFAAEIDREAVAALAARTYIPAPLSIYRGIFKLPPATILSVEAGADPLTAPPRTGEAGRGLRLSSYWSYRDVVAEGLADPITDREEAIDTVEEALRQAISDQAVADVPVGAFLSGGFDSSTVTALYQQVSGARVKTYSIGFTEAGFDEAPHARAVAAHLGTEHHEMYVSPAEAQAVLPNLATIYDEPFADSSQIPTYLVSRFARSDVTVALTGDGGDELFGGYNRHIIGPELWRRLAPIPSGVRALGRPLGHLPQRWFELLVRSGPKGSGAARIAKGLKVATTASGPQDIYASFIDEWAFEANPVLGAAAPRTEGLALAGASPAELMMLGDALGYLPDDILCKVDRASMAVSLETRVPFLDHRLAAVAARVPLAMKIADGRGKLPIRAILDRHVPRALTDRPKAGFGIPVGEWMRGPLRAWADDLLSEDRLRREGLFNVKAVRRRYLAHQAGTRDSTSALWPILMFESWRDAQKDTLGAAA
ncbi:asparagine synthase (glutamine-hydrolyzing) [Sphingomonas astaxanthinifaciens]|uniref:asparagine synthase (glutamine-hydrolyzing) n=1 Tax=Sphingomonas astaxanthinifaciens DSM 22298 TaxID=1123267 RepID=A0ABQ5Z2G0_9SPHN|nr:asparagine synthase (glutamine-hydrolyzing) [Sphingomonas astaxanthinifaciens]GLR46964.1 asparagine synthetase B [Sphingomonas astaxanthinifaciens DSM 22298]